MTTTVFYREQAEQQQRAADDAALANVRERCQRASNAWSALANRSERNDATRILSANEKLAAEPGA